jgi:phosphohistidine phosphatase
MHLYLIRHADAQPVGGTVRTDADRPLSARGEEDALALGRVLAATDPGIRLILTSPLERAVQTGARIAAAMPVPPERRITDHLAPGLRSRALTEELLALGSDARVVLVGHQPDMSTLLARLVGDGPRGAIAFVPGTVAFVTATPLGQQMEAQLRWLLTPQLAALLLERMESRKEP